MYFWCFKTSTEIHRIVSLLLFTCIAINAYSQSTQHNLTLAEAITLSMEQNREIEVARYEYMASKYSTREEWSAFLPQVSFNSQYTDSYSQLFQFDAPPDTGEENGEGFNPDEFGFQGARYLNKFQMRQLIYDRSVIGRIKLANLQQDAAYWQQKGQEQIIVSQTVQMFLNVLRSQELLQVQQQRLDLAQQQLEIAELNFEVGMRIKTDVLRAELTRSSAERDVVSAEISVERALTQLNRLLGVDLTNRYSLQADNLKTFNPNQKMEATINNYNQLFAITEKENPSIQVADILVRQQNESVQIARGEFYPNMDIQGNWGFNDQGSPDLKKEEWNLMISANIPIFEGGRRIAKVSRTKEQLNAEEKRFEATTRQVFESVEIASLTILEDKRNLEIAQKAVTVAQENFERFQNLYQEGLADSLDVTQALTELVTAQTDLVTARYNFMQVYTQLIANLGIIPVHQYAYEDLAWLQMLDNPIEYFDNMNVISDSEPQP